jgi:UDPglucose 6-dehydrogenase
MSTEPRAIGIVGGGFVGSATALFACTDIQVKIYDILPEKCSPQGTTLEDLLGCVAIFICVPTPSASDGECDTRIVESAVLAIKAFERHPPIVVRSTVPPGTCERLGVIFMPEFLREASWADDFHRTCIWYIGSDTYHGRGVLTDIISSALYHGTVQGGEFVFISSKAAEMIKYTRNVFLATKIAFCNEVYELCQALEIDYEVVRSGMDDDQRIGSSHTLVPGPDRKLGFGGHCLPKDTLALAKVFETNGIHPHTIVGALATNKRLRN